jgi:hypothetical protein
VEDQEETLQLKILASPSTLLTLSIGTNFDLAKLFSKQIQLQTIRQATQIA